MSPDWRGALSSTDPPVASPPLPLPLAPSAATPREPEALAAGQTPRALAADDTGPRAAQSARSAPVAARPAPASGDDDAVADRPAAAKARTPLPSRPAAGPSHGVAPSAANARDSARTASTDQVITPPASDSSAGLDAAAPAEAAAAQLDRAPRHSPMRRVVARHGVDVLHMSDVAAAAQARMVMDEAGAGSRKRMADGAVKLPSASAGTSPSPARGHSRTTSAISAATTAGSNIGEVSADLKTLLSYAMVKVNHGWQSRSLGEVESLASRATSPSSSHSTACRHHDSSASPRQGLMTSATAQIHLAHDPASARRKLASPPTLFCPARPTLAPPAPIQPSVTFPGRSSTPRCPPVLLPHPSLLSPHTPDPASRPEASQTLISRAEQDVAETLLFMNSPGNSANLKHSRPSASTPGTQAALFPRAARGRHALPGAPRKALPSQRPAGSMAPPSSPKDRDSPRQSHNSPRRAMPRRQANGAPLHVQAALSLSSGLGLSRGIPRRTLCEEDIERMLDRASNEPPDTSDNDEIQLPHGRRGVAAATRAP